MYVSGGIPPFYIKFVKQLDNLLPKKSRNVRGGPMLFYNKWNDVGY